MVSADTRGQFRMQVPAGRRIKLRLTGQGGTERKSIGGELHAAAGARDLVPQAVATATDRSLRVLVTDPEGRPIVGIMVVVGLVGGHRPGTTDLEIRLQWKD